MRRHQPVVKDECACGDTVPDVESAHGVVDAMYKDGETEEHHRFLVCSAECMGQRLREVSTLKSNYTVGDATMDPTT